MLSSTDFSGMQHFVRRVSADLTSVGPAVALPEKISSDASIVWTGTNYVVTGAFGPITIGVRLDADAHLLDADAMTIAEGPATGSSASPSVASNGRDLFVAWTGRVEPNAEISPDVYGSLASASTLTPRSSMLLSVTPRRQSRPSITTGIASLLALWSEADGLWAKRLARNGASIDATPIRVFGQEGVATATFNGTDFIVAWTDSREIRTFRIPSDGPLRFDVGGRIAAWDGFSLALASDGATTILAMSGNAARVVRLGHDAIFLHAPLMIAEGVTGTVDISPNGQFFVASSAMLPDVAWDGERYVIAWLGTDGRFATAYRAAWISRLGTPPVHAVEFGEAEHWPPSPITVTTIGPGDVAFSYARLAHEAGSVARAFVITRGRRS